mmetsp:Transcript_36455/g.92128  ORF Transcript_36455/g.92128 Transcript_36455/m.92128 type:complete len:90 (+) Transcript_36455:116-385(+)
MASLSSAPARCASRSLPSRRTGAREQGAQRRLAASRLLASLQRGVSGSRSATRDRAAAARELAEELKQSGPLPGLAVLDLDHTVRHLPH